MTRGLSRQTPVVSVAPWSSLRFAKVHPAFGTYIVHAVSLKALLMLSTLTEAIETCLPRTSVVSLRWPSSPALVVSYSN
jgi:hypothetical protein